MVERNPLNFQYYEELQMISLPFELLLLNQSILLMKVRKCLKTKELAFLHILTNMFAKKLGSSGIQTNGSKNDGESK